MKMEMELAAMFLAEHLPVDIMHVDADDHIDCGKAVLGRRGFLEPFAIWRWTITHINT